MIVINGAQQSGSGTIVRYAIAFSALLGQPLQLFNARAKREQPGLRPQHLASVLACAELCQAKTEIERMGVWMALRVVRASDLGVLKDVIAHGKQILQIALLLLRIVPAAPMQQPLRPSISYRLRHACPPWLNRSSVQHLP